MIPVICKGCRKEFPAQSSRRQFCSNACANLGITANQLPRLNRYARLGLTVNYMATQFGVQPSTVRRALRRHGLYHTWMHARFVKCQEPAFA